MRGGLSPHQPELRGLNEDLWSDLMGDLESQQCVLFIAALEDREAPACIPVVAVGPHFQHPHGRAGKRETDSLPASLGLVQQFASHGRRLPDIEPLALRERGHGDFQVGETRSGRDVVVGKQMAGWVKSTPHNP